jgi:hypothetical protein
LVRQELVRSAVKGAKPHILAGGFFQKQFSHRSNEFLHNEEYLKLKVRTDVFARPVAAARLQAKGKRKRGREQQAELFSEGAATSVENCRQIALA